MPSTHGIFFYEKKKRTLEILHLEALQSQYKSYQTDNIYAKVIF